MKKGIVIAALLFAVAGYVYLQTPAPVGEPGVNLAAVMPSGALIYLQASNFGRLLQEWDSSQVKRDWLQSANYEAFSRSNLFSKLAGVYREYGSAAGFFPDLRSAIDLAGTDSALALYEVRDVEFLYISRITESDLAKSQLWIIRDKFEQRQAGGVPFYLRNDPTTKRTVAFAFAKGYLLLATRDDLVAQSLELFGGGSNPSIASERWYHDASDVAKDPGELRMVMNLESLVKSDHFRSYWVQRNVSAIRPYSAGVADVRRTSDAITENRVFLRSPGSAEPLSAQHDPAAVANLVALVPPDAGVYKAWAAMEPSATAGMIVQKVIAVRQTRPRDWREAPEIISPDNAAGTEADLETRIDEQPLPKDAGVSDSVAATQTLIDTNGPPAILLVQSSSPAGVFIQTPSVIVVESKSDWDANAIRNALSRAAGKLLTTSQVGAGWTSSTAGRQQVERLDGLTSLFFAARSRYLFLGNSAPLLASVMDRAGTSGSAEALTYAAGFRHLRERANYERIMTALDFAPTGGMGFMVINRGGGAPPFFSGNVASLSRVLSTLVEIRVTEQESEGSKVQKVVYQMAR